jgi:predicted CoA-binding protein
MPDTAPAASPSELLARSKTIAVVGYSTDPTRTSHRIAHYLADAGFDVIPVNPKYEQAMGRTCYAKVSQIPAEVQVDLVDIFRQPRFTHGVVEDIVARMEATGDRPVVWTQIGVHSQEAEQLASEAGLPYVRNRCTLIEHVQ